jgi:RimJ/RimL family protein N-acetyltransferase
MNDDPSTILETERLVLRRFIFDDAAFILELLNDSSFLRFIGDRNVRSLEDARGYILNGPMASYEKFGFGLWLVKLKVTDESMGMCGLLKRDNLPDVDIGFAFLPRFWGREYAVEAAAAVRDYGRDVVGLKRLVAITDRVNKGSIRVLEKTGLRFERMIAFHDGEPESRLFGLDF